MNKGTRANVGMSSQDTGVHRQAAQRVSDSVSVRCGSKLEPLQDMFVSNLADSVDEATLQDI